MQPQPASKFAASAAQAATPSPSALAPTANARSPMMAPLAAPAPGAPAFTPTGVSGGYPWRTMPQPYVYQADMWDLMMVMGLYTYES